jgi:hypothetical protein
VSRRWSLVDRPQPKRLGSVGLNGQHGAEKNQGPRGRVVYLTATGGGGTAPLFGAFARLFAAAFCADPKTVDTRAGKNRLSRPQLQRSQIRSVGRNRRLATSVWICSGRKGPDRVSPCRQYQPANDQARSMSRTSMHPGEWPTCKAAPAESQQKNYIGPSLSRLQAAFAHVEDVVRRRGLFRFLPQKQRQLPAVIRRVVHDVKHDIPDAIAMRIPFRVPVIDNPLDVF